MLKIRANRQPMFEGDEIELRLLDYEKGEICTGLVMEKAACGSRIPPGCTIGDEAAQALVDSLWECGIRARQSSGSIGQLGATEKHLEDMRTIAFKFLGGEK